MYKIIDKQILNENVTLMEIEAPNVAKRCEAGQFIILRVDENGERIPLTIANYNRDKGTINIIFQIVGATTGKLNLFNVGDSLETFVGPLGKPTETEGLKKAIVIGGGLGSAIALPIARKLKENGTSVISITGFRKKDLVILEKEFNEYSDKMIVATDDGSNGNKGFVTDYLKQILEQEKDIDCVFVIGPLIMMKFVAKLTKEYNVKTIASMNPLMVDGTGMCGGCRITVGGKVKFACVDGPDFDAHEIDFDEAIARSTIYKPFEQKKYRDLNCNLMKMGEENGKKNN